MNCPRPLCPHMSQSFEPTSFCTNFYSAPKQPPNYGGRQGGVLWSHSHALPLWDALEFRGCACSPRLGSHSNDQVFTLSGLFSHLPRMLECVSRGRDSGGKRCPAQSHTSKDVPTHPTVGQIPLLCRVDPGRHPTRHPQGPRTVLFGSPELARWGNCGGCGDG